MNKKIKRLFLGFFSLALFFSLSGQVYAAENSNTVSENYIKIITYLTSQDFINADIALSNEPNFENMNEAEKDNYVMEFIVNNSNLIQPLAQGELPETYYGLNVEELALAKAYPYQATQYYMSSTVAKNYTASKFGYNGAKDASDAFRHTFWNSNLTMRIGSSAAKEWTTAHEYGSTGIDRTMDLFNNSVGRTLCIVNGYESLAGSSNTLGIATADLANIVYSAVANGETLMIVNNTLVPSYIN